MLFRKIYIFVFVAQLYGAGLPYYYYNIKSPKKQKQEFIDILLHLVKNSNEKVRKERKFIISFFQKAQKDSFRGLGRESIKKLIHLYRKYKIINLFGEKEYLLKIDIVPVSLAIAQGATESGWGKSRFILEANNIFGQWTYTGNGLVPANRDEGKIHTIRIYKTLQDSVNSYVLNLNKNNAYKFFRDLRYEAHKRNIIFNGLMASKAMIYYSQNRGKYIKLLDSIITSNNLLYYDDEYSLQSLKARGL